MVFEDEHYIDGVLDVQAALATIGLDKFDNKYANYFLASSTFTPYKGYNTVMNNADGETFEIQLHTPDSFAKKMEIHAWYEMFRSAPAGSSEKSMALNKMDEIMDDFEVPDGVERLNGNIPGRSK